MDEKIKEMAAKFLDLVFDENGRRMPVNFSVALDAVTLVPDERVAILEEVASSLTSLRRLN